MDNEKKIEIPFGAFDSELIRQEISIPNDFKATIEGDKIILTKIESEDEKIRKWLIGYFHQYKEDGMEKYANGLKVESIIAWLEKQGEVVSDNDDIEVEEKGIREAFNKIWEEKQDKQKSQRMISAEAKEAMYDKPAWSEDDEKMLVDAYVMLDWYKGNNWWTARRIKDWLNSLKERIGG